MRPPSRRIISALVVLAVLAPSAISAATPGTGVKSLQLNQSSQEGRDFVVRDITIDPGGSTGWHWHDGTLVGAIKHGTLTHYSADCSVDGVYNAGDPVTEPAGSDHVHLGRNLGSTPVVLEVIYILPAGKPLAEDAPNPGCPFG
ncbi:cupin [Mycobacterium sp. 1100029.7]|nr:cupin [Mycobacterium sp. 1100029.7]